MRGRSDGRFLHPAEGVALDYLIGKGHLPLRHNFRTKIGEIDLITCNPNSHCIHFIEVKSWKADVDFPPLISQNARRRRIVYKLASIFIAELEKYLTDVRRDDHCEKGESGLSELRDISDMFASNSFGWSFDLAIVSGETVEHIEQIF